MIGKLDRILVNQPIKKRNKPEKDLFRLLVALTLLYVGRDPGWFDLDNGVEVVEFLNLTSHHPA